jgi:hypothetical protein
MCDSQNLILYNIFFCFILYLFLLRQKIYIFNKKKSIEDERIICLGNLKGNASKKGGLWAHFIFSTCTFYVTP